MLERVSLLAARLLVRMATSSSSVVFSAERDLVVSGSPKAIGLLSEKAVDANGTLDGGDEVNVGVSELGNNCRPSPERHVTVTVTAYNLSNWRIFP